MDKPAFSMGNKFLEGCAILITKKYKTLSKKTIDKMKTDSYNKSTVWFLSTPIRIFARCAAADSIGGSFFCLIKVSKIGLVHDQRESRSHREERRLIYSKLNQYNSTFFLKMLAKKKELLNLPRITISTCICPWQSYTSSDPCQHTVMAGLRKFCHFSEAMNVKF